MVLLDRLTVLAREKRVIEAAAHYVHVCNKAMGDGAMVDISVAYHTLEQAVNAYDEIRSQDG